MRKFLFLTLLMATSMIYAGPVSKQQAQQSAVIFLNKKSNVNSKRSLKMIHQQQVQNLTEVNAEKDAAFYVSEIIREKLLTQLKDEVPQELAVRVDSIEHKSHDVYIKATILVDKESHKGIVIGKGGKQIKSIGIKARKTLEQYFNKHIFLELFVSVKEDWLNNPRILKELGYK